jgi:hypothetical protein
MTAPQRGAEYAGLLDEDALNQELQGSFSPALAAEFPMHKWFAILAKPLLLCIGAKVSWFLAFVKSISYLCKSTVRQNWYTPFMSTAKMMERISQTSPRLRPGWPVYLNCLRP